MNKLILAIVLFVSGTLLKAQNPIVPPGVYIADPSAHVWKDGRMYIYGSRDESPLYFCSKQYQILFSNDLENWELSDTCFATVGSNDQVSYSDALLYAPDAQYYNGKYYLYYCLSERLDGTEGVAVSDSPTGPFKDGQKIKLGRMNEIDPCVFVDDDGQGYYVWGQFRAKMAKMKPNMMEIDSSTIVKNVVTQKDHFFHEGSYMIKRNDLYYLVYADVSRRGIPTCLGYSTSESPMGPYTYRGVIIDNNHCDPKVWNNHGSLVEFKGRWYVFYHRSTHGCISMRKTCIEPISFAEDGTIPEVLMTSQGAGKPLDANEKIDGGRACSLVGNIRISAIAKNNEALTGANNGDQALFRYIDFDNGVSRAILRVAPGSKQCRITIDTGDKNTLCTINVPAQKSKEWITLKVPVKSVQGVHPLCLTFSDPSIGQGHKESANEIQEEKIELCKLDYIYFD